MHREQRRQLLNDSCDACERRWLPTANTVELHAVTESHASSYGLNCYIWNGSDKLADAVFRHTNPDITPTIVGSVLHEAAEEAGLEVDGPLRREISNIFEGVGDECE